MFGEITTGLMALAIPIISIVLGITVAIVAVVTGHQRRIRELDHRHQQRMAAIEKGVDLPADPPTEFRPRTPGSPLLRGLIWLGVGLALVFNHIDYDLERLGWVPAAIGMAYLIYYVVEWPKKRIAEQK
jgi:hypothetical protein